jgi:hypothetical protein
VLERGFSSNKLLMCLLKSCAVADRATRNMLVPLFYPSLLFMCLPLMCRLCVRRKSNSGRVASPQDNQCARKAYIRAAKMSPQSYTSTELLPVVDDRNQSASGCDALLKNNIT